MDLYSLNAWYDYELRRLDYMYEVAEENADEQYADARKELDAAK